MKKIYLQNIDISQAEREWESYQKQKSSVRNSKPKPDQSRKSSLSQMISATYDKGLVLVHRFVVSFNCKGGISGVPIRYWGVFPSRDV